MKEPDKNGPMIRFYTLKNMNSVRPVVGRGIAASFPRHIHHSLCVGIVDRGTRCIETCSGEKHVAGPGEMFILNPGQAHSCVCGHPSDTENTRDAGHDYRVLSLDPGLFRDTFSSASMGAYTMPDFDRITFRDTGLARAMNTFFGALQTSKKCMAPEPALDEILERLKASHTNTPTRSSNMGADRGALVRVRDYLDTHFDTNVRLEDLIDIAGLSRFHLQRQFSLHMGVSPRGYLLQRRSARAAKLLDQGMEPAEVAVSVGFVDQSHLTKTFKRFVGITPGRFRASHEDKKARHRS